MLVDVNVRCQVAGALSLLLERLPVAVGKVCDALSHTQPAKVRPHGRAAGDG